MPLQTLLSPLNGWLARLGLHRAKPFRLNAHFRQRLGGLDRPAQEEADAQYWVLSRGLTRLRVLPLTNVPAAKRAAAIDLALSGWQPHADTKHYVVPQAQSALLFAWDGALVAEAMAEAGVNAESLRIVPENALHRPPSPADAHASQLFHTLDGVEARHHRAGMVVAAQWWPHAPNEREWHNTVRTLTDGAADPPREPPAPQPTAWGDFPRGYAAGEHDRDMQRREWGWVAVAAWLLALPTLWYANQWRQLSAAQADTERRAAAMDRELGGALTAREQALDALLRGERLQTLFVGNDMLHLFAQINETLGALVKPGTWQIADWDYRERRLKFVLVAPSGGAPATTALVKTLENVPGYRDVQALADGNRIAVELTVGAPPPTAPPPATAAADGKG